MNPGANSCIGNGPISWSPAVAGYPALLVDADNAADADFSINATNRPLSEKENGTNYNPSGASHEEFGQDSDTNDIYRSAIRGLIAVRDDLTVSKPCLGPGPGHRGRRIVQLLWRTGSRISAGLAAKSASGIHSAVYVHSTFGVGSKGSGAVGVRGQLPVVQLLTFRGRVILDGATDNEPWTTRHAPLASVGNAGPLSRHLSR